MKTLDTSGMSCPQPVLMTKKILDTKVDALDVTVDNKTAQESVQRFMEGAGYTVEIEQVDAKFILKARK
ncbi:MAG: sulfurtransferase TusA family protein [Bacillota bacterium]